MEPETCDICGEEMHSTDLEFNIGRCGPCHRDAEIDNKQDDDEDFFDEHFWDFD